MKTCIKCGKMTFPAFYHHGLIYCEKDGKEWKKRHDDFEQWQVLEAIKNL